MAGLLVAGRPSRGSAGAGWRVERSVADVGLADRADLGAGLGAEADGGVGVLVDERGVVDVAADRGVVDGADGRAGLRTEADGGVGVLVDQRGVVEVAADVGAGDRADLGVGLGAQPDGGVGVLVDERGVVQIAADGRVLDAADPGVRLAPRPIAALVFWFRSVVLLALPPICTPPCWAIATGERAVAVRREMPRATAVSFKVFIVGLLWVKGETALDCRRPHRVYHLPGGVTNALAAFLLGSIVPLGETLVGGRSHISLGLAVR
ncbi:MAG: hypothetical protein R3C69_18600 [Geminicoccaceae bacterium]